MTGREGRAGGDNHTMRPGFRSPDRSPASVRFAVRLTPRAGADSVDGVSDDGVLQVRVAAPPVDGAANAALVRLLADELDVARTSVQMVAGATGRRKLMVVDGVSPEEAEARWPGVRV